MAVAFATSTATSQQNDSAVAATKPTGLAAGNALVALCFRNDDGGGTPADFTAPDGSWTKLGTTTDDNARITGFAKIADSSDAAASTFSFTPTTTVGDKSVIVLMRITGDFSGGLAALFADAQGSDASNGGENHVSYSGLTPVGTNALLIMALLTQTDTADVAFSAYATANNNPTWTELYDAVYDPSGVGLQYAVAYGSYASASATGNFSATVDLNETYQGFLISINESINATTTPDPVVLTLSIPAVVPTGGATATAPDPVALILSMPTATPTAAAPKWVNPDKPSTATFTNAPKS